VFTARYGTSPYSKDTFSLQRVNLLLLYLCPCYARELTLRNTNPAVQVYSADKITGQEFSRGLPHIDSIVFLAQGVMYSLRKYTSSVSYGD
jgi:hypothetical protein